MRRIAIIGGGVIGASAAYRLAQSGAHVTLVDRGHTGQATAAGAGILPPSDHFIPGAELGNLVSQARAHYPELLERLRADAEPDTGYDVVGALHVATDSAELARLERVAGDAEQRAKAGLPHVGNVRVLGAEATRELFPALGPSVLGAVHMSGAARVDGRRLLAALRRAAARRGVEWLEGEARLSLRAGSVNGIVVGERVYAADAVIIAGGAWSRALAEPLGVEIAVAPQRGQLAHLQLAGTNTSRWPIVLGFGSLYLLTFPEDRVVAGATREDGAGYDARVTAAGAAKVLNDALSLAPRLAQSTLLELRVGLRPVAADGKPVLGAHPRAPNVYFATGHGGFGLELGPYSGALVAGLALGEPPPPPLAAFAPQRFERH